MACHNLSQQHLLIIFLAIQAIALGLTSTNAVYFEIAQNFKVILLLIFMVASI